MKSRTIDADLASEGRHGHRGRRQVEDLCRLNKYILTEKFIFGDELDIELSEEGLREEEGLG